MLSSATDDINGKFTSVVGLLGAVLFFAGWIYRWAYFYFFQLEISNLDLPAQSLKLSTNTTPKH